MAVTTSNMGEMVNEYTTKATMFEIESGLRKKIGKVVDKIVSEMMKGVRVRTSLQKSIDDSNYIITHRVTFTKKKRIDLTSKLTTK